MKANIIDPVILTTSATSKEGIAKMVDEIVARLDARTQEADFADALRDLKDLVKENYGFMLEIDGAFSLDFPNNTFSYSTVPTWGLWVVPSYRLKNGKFDFLGIVRYIYNAVPEEPAHNFDAGARVLYLSKKVNFGFEGIYRYQNTILSKTVENGVTTTQTKTCSDYRLVANFEYMISDKLAIACNFGRNFNKNTGMTGDLVASVGLNFGLGGPRLDSFSQK